MLEEGTEIEIGDLVTNPQYPGKTFRVIEAPEDLGIGGSRKRAYVWGEWVAVPGSRYALDRETTRPVEFSEPPSSTRDPWDYK